MITVNVTKQLLQELKLATEKVLSLYQLRGSDLSKSVEFTYSKSTNQFELLAFDYFQAVASGRRPRARKVPVEDLIKWMKSKGITPRNGSYNTVAYLIQNAIYKSGIKARPFTNPIVDVTTDIISEDLVTTLSESIATEIAKDLSIQLP